MPHLAALLLFLGLSVAATWPLTLRLWWQAIDYGDSLTSAYIIAWQAHVLVTAPLHLFDATVMYPFQGTLAYDELDFAPALLGAPIVWLTGNAILAYNGVLLISFVLCGYGAWLLVRDLTGSPAAGIVAGVAFTFSFFRFNNLAHLTLLNVQWLPLLLLALHGLWRRPTWRSAAAVGGLVTLQALSSHYLAFYTLGAVGLFVAFYGVAERRVARAFLGRLAVALGGAGLLCLPLAVGYLVGQDGGYHRELADIARYTATLPGWLAVYMGNPLYKALLAPFADPSPWPWERSLFPGLVAPGLALIAAVAAWRLRGQAAWTRHVCFYALLTAVTVVLAFGPQLVVTFSSDPTLPLPYGLLYAWVPGVPTMRVVTRIMALGTLGLAVLAGFGTARVLAGGAGRRGVRWAAPALAGLLLLESWSAPLSLLPLSTGADTPPLYGWLAAQPRDTVVVEYPMLFRQRGARNVAVIGLNEYYNTTYWLRTPNGATTVRPQAWVGLTAEMDACFPCPRSLDILWALGVPLAAVHLEHLSGAQAQEFDWRSTAGLAAGLYPDEFVRVADFGANRVYRIARHGPNPVANLRDHLRPGATLALGAATADPQRTGAYIDALAYWLRDWPQVGASARSFGQAITPRLPATRTDYALLYTGEDPASYGFAADAALWHNEQVVLYGRP